MHVNELRRPKVNGKGQIYSSSSFHRTIEEIFFTLFYIAARIPRKSYFQLATNFYLYFQVKNDTNTSWFHIQVPTKLCNVYQKNLYINPLTATFLYTKSILLFMANLTFRFYKSKGRSRKWCSRLKTWIA